mmetsp:Transcript_20146/g.47360  ORF Transcript_20146/g.47360 Transcript_20146/m.47360 type:complete len:207 (+) Transcript_20146:863-1483(+)
MARLETRQEKAEGANAEHSHEISCHRVLIKNQEAEFVALPVKDISEESTENWSHREASVLDGSQKCDVGCSLSSCGDLCDVRPRDAQRGASDTKNDLRKKQEQQALDTHDLREHQTADEHYGRAHDQRLRVTLLDRHLPQRRGGDDPSEAKCAHSVPQPNCIPSQFLYKRPHDWEQDTSIHVANENDSADYKEARSVGKSLRGHDG